MTFDQSEFELRCEWGLAGVAQLAPVSDVVIIVDVLSFSTAVDIAVSRGAIVFPYGSRDAALDDYAHSKSAHVAQGTRTGSGGFSLSPQSLLSLPAGYRLVLPSPNGAALSLATGGAVTLTACLRNATAVAEAARRLGTTIAVIPAGEQWSDGGLRPSIEDFLGAGAVLAALPGRPSPEALAAIGAFENLRNSLSPVLAGCGSGKELIERGFASDLTLAAQLDVSTTVPRLQEAAFRSHD